MNDNLISPLNFVLVGLMAYVFIYLADRMLAHMGPQAVKFTIAQ